MADESDEVRARMREIVVEITEGRVEPPRMDRAPASAHRFGVFSRFTSALEWLSESRPDEDGGNYRRSKVHPLDCGANVGARCRVRSHPSWRCQRGEYRIAPRIPAA
jgi:hypothetical protein